MESATSPHDGRSKKQFLEVPRSPATEPTADETQVIIHKNDEKDAIDTFREQPGNLAASQRDPRATTDEPDQNAQQHKQQYQLRIQEEVLPIVLVSRRISTSINSYFGKQFKEFVC